MELTVVRIVGNLSSDLGERLEQNTEHMDCRYLAVLEVGLDIQEINTLDILPHSLNKLSCGHDFCRPKVYGSLI